MLLQNRNKAIKTAWQQRGMSHDVPFSSTPVSTGIGVRFHMSAPIHDWILRKLA